MQEGYYIQHGALFYSYEYPLFHTGFKQYKTSKVNKKLIDGDIGTCVRLKQQTPSSTIDLAYEISWNVQPWGTYATIETTFSTSFQGVNNSVIALVTYDNDTSGVRKYSFCSQKSVQELSENLLTQPFNCSCTSDCFIVIKVRYPVIQDGENSNFHLCEIYIT